MQLFSVKVSLSLFRNNISRPRNVKVEIRLFIMKFNTDCILICRRSIHSYKVTETTRKTVTKDKDGNVTEDVSIDKTTTETDSKVQPAGRMARLLKVLPGILMLLILAALAYYVTAVRL